MQDLILIARVTESHATREKCLFRFRFVWQISGMGRYLRSPRWTFTLRRLAARRRDNWSFLGETTISVSRRCDVTGVPVVLISTLLIEFPRSRRARIHVSPSFPRKIRNPNQIRAIGGRAEGQRPRHLSAPPFSTVPPARQSRTVPKIFLL